MAAEGFDVGLILATPGLFKLHHQRMRNSFVYKMGADSNDSVNTVWSAYLFDVCQTVQLPATKKPIICFCCLLLRPPALSYVFISLNRQIIVSYPRDAEL
jgi:hypothetical protein